VRIPIASSTESDYRKLAQLADQLYLSGKVSPPTKINSANNSQKPRPSIERIRKPEVSATAQQCWFHSRFGDRAKRCLQPCSWSGKRLVGSASDFLSAGPTNRQPVIQDQNSGIAFFPPASHMEEQATTPTELPEIQDQNYRRPTAPLLLHMALGL
jgi:hypothetical protein